jgi:acyl-CoA dehydrogenase
MDFALTEDQQTIRDSVLKIASGFDDDYWLERDSASGGFPDAFYKAFADDGWLGIAMPEEYGGAGLGIMEATLMMQAVAESGACLSGASALHMNIFGLKPVEIFGNEEQRERFLPPLIQGREKACFAVTEPNVGLDTTKLKTKATPDGNGYVVNGSKIWISTAQVADKVLLLARTTDIEDVKKPTEGLTLFYTDLDRDRIEVREIEKMGRKAVDSNMLFIDGLKVPIEDRIGEEGMGFRYILEGMNPERILIAAEAGFEACQTAVMTHGGMGYAKEYQVERYMREVMIARIAPISPQLVLSFLAERVLGLPKSY